MDEIEKKQTEFSLQSNQISNSMYYCSAIERKLIAVAISRMEKGYSYFNGERFATFGIKMTVKEILAILGKRAKSGAEYKIIKNAVKTLIQRQIEIKTPTGYQFFNWFLAGNYNTKTNTVELAFSPYVAMTILDKTKGYSKLDFIILGNLKSQYSIGFYELAKSYEGFKGKDGNKKNQWFFEMSVEEVRRKFQIKDEEYSETKNLIQWVIKKPIEELNKINTFFNIEIIKIKQGNKTVGFKFLCTEKIKQYKISKNEPKAIRDEKAEINEEEKLIARLMRDFPEEYQNLLEEELSQGCLFGDPQVWAENRAKVRLLENHKNAN